MAVHGISASECLCQHEYDAWFTAEVYSRSLLMSLADVSATRLRQLAANVTSIRIEYADDVKSFRAAAKQLNIMQDCKVSAD